VTGLHLGVRVDEIQCAQNATTRTILVSNFISGLQTDKNIAFQITGTRIRNPISPQKPATVTIQTSTTTYKLDNGRSFDWFASSTIMTSATVSPNTLQTSLPDVEYLFTLKTQGPIL
jgi:hypothetical protein